MTRLAIFAALILGCVVLAYALLDLISPMTMWEKLVLPRLRGEGISGSTRATSNWQALRIVAETYGLGAGLGSNRASSYALSLLSNLGVLLTLGYFALLASQAGLMLRKFRHEALGITVFAGMATACVGVCVSIPDLNWPGWWVWIIASFAIAMRPRAISSR